MISITDEQKKRLTYGSWREIPDPYKGGNLAYRREGDVRQVLLGAQDGQWFLEEYEKHASGKGFNDHESNANAYWSLEQALDAAEYRRNNPYVR